MHDFLALREKLSPLRFDPLQDASAADQIFLKDYLNFYHLTFSENICSKHSVGTFEGSNYTIVVHCWLPANTKAKGTIFIFHGYYDHVGLLRHAIQFALEQGYIAVAYDLPGHGLSSGERASIHHFAEYVNVLQTCLKKASSLTAPWFAMGQSTGGAVLLHSLLVERITNPFKGIVLLAPLIKPAGWGQGKWLYYLLKPFIKKIPRRISENSHDREFVHFVHYEDPLQSKALSVTWTGAMKEWLEAFPKLTPISVHGLLIQGDDDHTVAWRDNLPLVKAKIQGLEYQMIAGGRHHLLNESEELRQQIFTRIRQFLLASC